MLRVSGRPDEYSKLFPPELGVMQCLDCKGRDGSTSACEEQSRYYARFI